MTKEFQNQEVIQVSDICDKVEELEDETETLVMAFEDLEAPDELGKSEHEEELQELQDQLKPFTDLLEELEGNGGDHQWRGDWYPSHLINENYFTEYAKELCQNIGDIRADLPEYIVIDWEATADNLKVDYTDVDFVGESWLYR